MRLVIVTGMSGAGKSTALKMLEDMGFYCADNLPIPLAGKFAELVDGSGEIKSAALGLDVRSGEELSQLESTFEEWDRVQFPYEKMCIRDRIRADLVLLDISGADGDHDLGLIGQLKKHPQFAVGGESGEDSGSVVVVKQLSAELQIKLVSKLVDPCLLYTSRCV